MIAAVVDPACGAAKPLLFRGKDIPFWTGQMLAPLPFSALADPPQDAAFLLVFDGSQLWDCPASAWQAILGGLTNEDGESPRLLTVRGRPFVAMSCGYRRERKPLLEPGLFARLVADDECRLCASDEWTEVASDECRLLDAGRDPLAVETAILRFQVRQLIAAGVQVDDFQHFFLAGGVRVGSGSRLATGVVITGDSEIGRRVTIFPHCVIDNSRILDGCVILPGTVIRDSWIGENVTLGPYSHIREGSQVHRNAKMGNFVEMKKSVLGEGSKAMHLSYIGDATVGERVNIGAGTITCNYDGEKKHPTIIEDGVFIGSGTELVAPVTVHRNSYVGAGSTITEDVPENALAIARQRQRNVLDWVLRKNKKKKK